MNGNELARKVMGIPGRCHVLELRHLYHLALQAPPGLPMIDLGTFQGRTAAMLCAAAKQIGSEVVTIDNYVQDPAFTGGARLSNDPGAHKSPEEYANLTRENLANLGFHARVVIGDSAIVPDGVEEIGLLFIDSEHNGERFNAECDAWLPLMPKGGILACHDYQQPSWPLMTPVIDERIRSRPDEWEYLGLMIWLIGFKKIT